MLPGLTPAFTSSCSRRSSAIGWEGAGKRGSGGGGVALAGECTYYSYQRHLRLFEPNDTQQRPPWYGFPPAPRCAGCVVHVHMRNFASTLMAQVLEPAVPSIGSTRITCLEAMSEGSLL
jgi:hypothetical protein